MDGCPGGCLVASYFSIGHIMNTGPFILSIYFYLLYVVFKAYCFAKNGQTGEPNHVTVVCKRIPELPRTLAQDRPKHLILFNKTDNTIK